MEGHLAGLVGEHLLVKSGAVFCNASQYPLMHPGALSRIPVHSHDLSALGSW